MTDTVLQSFCERCGTRYTFTEPQESKPEGGRSKLGLFGRRAADSPSGAGSEPSVSTALPSSDHFKGTFHFCLDCRQYTCVNCWNTDAGACISCRPPGEPEAASRSAFSVAIAKPSAGQAEAKQPEAWPAGDFAARQPTHTDEAPAQAPGPAVEATTPKSRDADSGTQSPAGAAPVASADEANSPLTGELDEWGRPRQARPPATEPDTAAADQPATVFGAAPATDPWQGVVFSEDEDRTGIKPEARSTAARADIPTPEAERTMSPPPRVPSPSAPTASPYDAPPNAAIPEPADASVAPDHEGEASHRVEDVISGTAWPETDKAAATGSNEPAPVADRPTTDRADVEAEAGPEADDHGQDEGTKRLGDFTTTVDASAWAKAKAPPEASLESSSSPVLDEEQVPAAAPGRPPEEAVAAKDDAATAGDVAEPAQEDDAATAGDVADPALDAPAPQAERTELADEPEPSAPPPVPPQIGFVEPEPLLEVPVESDAEVDHTADDAQPLTEPPPAAPLPAVPPEPAPAPPMAQTPVEAPSAPPAPAEAPDLPPAPVEAPSAPPAPAEAPDLPPAPTPDYPPSPLAPIVAPAPTADVWRTPPQEGPFSQPYAAPAAAAMPPPIPSAAPPPSSQPPTPTGTTPTPPPSQPVPYPPPPEPEPAPFVPPAPAAAGFATSSPAPAPAPAHQPARPVPQARASTRACSSCALPLSAKARFCRRCGAPQS